jgi:hypothetical protein
MRDEKASALIVTFIVGIAVLIIGSIILYLVLSELKFVSYDEKEVKAFDVAEAGISKSIWELKATGSLPDIEYTVVTADGTAYVNSSMENNNFSWIITSRGVEDSGVERTIKIEAFVFNVWGTMFSNTTLSTHGGAVTGNASVTGPFYCKQDLELTGTTEIKVGPLFIRNGNLIFDSASVSVGTLAEPIDLFVTGNPIDGQGNYYEPYNGSNNSKLYVDTFSHSTPDISLPPLGASEIGTARNDAKHESTSSCQKVLDIDNQTNSNSNLQITSTAVQSRTNLITNMLLDNAEGSEFWLDYTDSNKYVLHINGTVFVDGDVTFGGPDIFYEGKGTIVATGNIYINSKLKPVNGTFPNINILGVATPASITMNTQNDPSSSFTSPDVALAAYSTVNTTIEKDIQYRGSLVSGLLTFKNNPDLYTDGLLSQHLPPNMPGSDYLIIWTPNWQEK